MKPKIYVITAVHNRYVITEKFVKSLLEQTYSNIHLILIDDGSTDGTQTMVKELMPNSTIIQGNGGLWWGGALHKAYKWLCKSNINEYDYVMFANDDTTFDNNYIETAIDLLKKQSNTLITGCGYSLNSGKLLDAAFAHDFKTGNRVEDLKADNEGNCASTRSLFFRATDFKKIRGFHPILLPHYASDYEWTIRASKKGFQIKSFKELKYYFDEGTTGNNEINNLTLRQLFSKRSNRNPIYRLNFILLTTPLKYLPVHLVIQFKRYIKKISILREVISRK